MSMAGVSNLVVGFTSHTALVQNSYRPPDVKAALLLAVPGEREPASVIVTNCAAYYRRASEEGKEGIKHNKKI